MPPESRAWELGPLQVYDFYPMPYYNRQKTAGLPSWQPGCGGKTRGGWITGPGRWV